MSKKGKRKKPVKIPPGKKPLKYWKPPKAKKLDRYRDPETGVIIEIDREHDHKTIIIEGPAPHPGTHMVWTPAMPYSEITKPIRDIDFKKLEKLEGKGN